MFDLFKFQLFIFSRLGVSGICWWVLLSRNGQQKKKLPSRQEFWSMELANGAIYFQILSLILSCVHAQMWISRYVAEPQAGFTNVHRNKHFNVFWFNDQRLLCLDSAFYWLHPKLLKQSFMLILVQCSVMHRGELMCIVFMWPG